jgi:hypothetical protein
VGQVVILLVVHACPRIDSDVVVPGAKLVKDDLGLWDYFLEEQVGWEQWVCRLAHSDDAVFCMSNSTL